MLKEKQPKIKKMLNWARLSSRVYPKTYGPQPIVSSPINSPSQNITPTNLYEPITWRGGKCDASTQTDDSDWDIID